MTSSSIDPSVFSADPSAGLAAEPRGGLESQGGPHTHPAEAGGFVREAVPDDLDAIGTVHASTMLASLQAAHRSAHDGAGLPDGVVAMIAAPVLTAGWEHAVLEPPSPEHHVLVATLGEEIVGILGLAPTEGAPAEGTEALDSPATPVPSGADGAAPAAADSSGSDDPAEEAPVRAVEVTALGVSPARQREGHGSRLLAAASDLAREAGAQVLLVWAVTGDESLTSFLDAVGMRPTASRRELPVGEGITEVCWAAVL